MALFTNKLAKETSPYLLQHAHNPVQWYPWGEEALAKAIAEDKPILVSIGYSACHWCHVMEKESFEDEETASLMNEHFINIKVDREERPDIDHIYMDAVQAMAGNGGWPLNVFLTPGKKPFYGGTYFPPVKAFNRPSWKEVLSGVNNLFTEKRSEVETQADELVDHLQKSNGFGISQPGRFILPSAEIFTRDQIDQMFQHIMKQADKIWGGFGNAPKFPQTFTIHWLLRYWSLTKDQSALDQALLTLDKMIDGGIYDQVGGGFARYSTDGEWLAPHFEKMLYDNALIIGVLSEAYQVTKNNKYNNTVKDTIAFLVRELKDITGGFYAALDADSEGVEGKFYVWSFEEINDILKERAPLFCRYYDVTPEGNWEHTNILRVLKPINVFSASENIDPIVAAQELEAAGRILLEHRSFRIRPGLDDKILLGWNAMMVTALCKAFSAFGVEEYRELAINNFRFLKENFCSENGQPPLSHVWKSGIAKYPAFIDDYACVIEAAIRLQEITSNNDYLHYAKTLTYHVAANFTEADTGYFFYTPEQQEDIVVRKKEVYDGATPSGNAVMASNLYYLSVIFQLPEWAERAAKMMSGLSTAIVNYPTSFGVWASLAIEFVRGSLEIAVVGEEFDKVRDEVLQLFLPGKIMQSARCGIDDFPLLSDKPASSNTLIYKCSNYSCQSPVDSVNGFVKEVLKDGKNFLSSNNI